jgi:hypothetical protein
MRIPAVVALVLVAALACIQPARPGSRSAIIGVTDVGSGAAEAWVFRPGEGELECVLTFIHDDGDLSPARYTSWIDYTVLRHHCAIVFPRYEVAAHGSNAANLRGLRAAVSTGMKYISTSVLRTGGAQALRALPAITAGFGSGGTLALAYATVAQDWGFNAPIAVDTVFPVVDDRASLPAKRLADRVHVLAQFGDRDLKAGPTSAKAVRTYLAARRGSTTIQVVHSSPALAAIHSAPLRVDSPSENTFWGPLDTLIDGVTP